MDKHNKIIIILKKIMELAELWLKNLILKQINEKGMQFDELQKENSKIKTELRKLKGL